MRIIGLAGKAGAGKDYTYEHIKKEYACKVARLAFADGVRHEIEDVLSPGTTVNSFRDAWEGKKLPAMWRKPYPDEIRSLLQWWGTEYRREQDPDYWVKKGVERLGEFDAIGIDLVVVTDVRFENEAKAIRALGGIVVEVVALDSIRAERLGGSLPPDHASEVIDFEVDFHIISNDGLLIPRQVTHYLSLASVEKHSKVEA